MTHSPNKGVVVVAVVAALVVVICWNSNVVVAFASVAAFIPPPQLVQRRVMLIPPMIIPRSSSSSSSLSFHHHPRKTGGCDSVNDRQQRLMETTTTSRNQQRRNDSDESELDNTAAIQQRRRMWWNRDDHHNKAIQTTLVSLTLAWSVWVSGVGGIGDTSSFLLHPAVANAAAASKDIVGCLLQKCPLPLAQCVADPRCLANVICINTCTGRDDEIGCQIKCGDYVGDSTAIAKFNTCVVSDMSCVPQQPDVGFYPIPTSNQVVSKFDSSFFNGKLYITAGQNPLFDTFDCQVHFFTTTEPGKFFAKLNWRITEPDGEYFTRDALQEFVQDPNDPSHLINHDNEFLHYKDDWYIIDYEYDNNPDKIPPFAFVYYRGSNDAWDGYGGVVVYTRDAALPLELLPRLRAAAAKINYDFDKDFTITDNSCPRELSAGEKVLLREKFAGKLVLQTEQQLQAAATRLRGNAVNSIKAQQLFFDNRLKSASDASQTLEQSINDFEQQQQ